MAQPLRPTLASGSRMTKRRLLEEARNSTWQISVQNIISSFLILILLFVFYSLFIFLERPRSPWEVLAEPLRLRGAQVGNLWFSDLIKWGSCIYVFLHEPEFSTVNPLVAQYLKPVYMILQIWVFSCSARYSPNWHTRNFVNGTIT